jgi:dTDP-4-amino-4,6-dideoxygalactose transaminase
MSAYKYKKGIASVLKCHPEQVFLYWKGRVALYAILKAMGIKEGDEVIIPAFTCVVVPNAILYLGAKPVYIDIKPENYNTDISKLNDLITRKTKVVICQNTFGLSSNIEKIVNIAMSHNIYTIEDCTHGFGGLYNGKPNGSYCDAAFYSTQWNKPFSTGIGGFLLVNNDDLVEKVRILESKKIKPTLTNQVILSFLLLFNRYFVGKYTYWSLVRFYRFLSKNNLIIGSTQGEELSNIKMPKNYFKNISPVQINAGLKELSQINRINNLRKKNAFDYTQFLKANNKIFVDKSLFDNHLFLKYPLLVKDRDSFLSLAEKNKISLGDWFLSPIHPVKDKFELWGLNPDLFPYAYNISKKIVNLPTDINDNKQVLDFLSRNLDMIE